jgi:two-component system, NtrC family, sensor kinase
MKGRRQDAQRPKRRNSPKAVAPSGSSRSREETENARLTRDLNEALEQQTATSEVLRVIRDSPGDLQPVFATMLEKAVRICDAKFGNIYRWDGEALHLLAAHDTPAALAEVRRRSAFRPTALVRHMVTTRTVAHVADLAASEDYVEGHPAAVAAVELGGVRTALLVPLLKEDELIGSFTLAGSASLYRQTDFSCHEFRRPSRYRH